MQKPTDAAIRLRLLVRRFAPFLRAAHQTAVNATASFAAWRVRRIVERTFEARENVFFVQIGSNDGSRGDPLYAAVRRHGHWRGILVEPVPFVFERLKNNYDNDPRLIFENVAILKGRRLYLFIMYPRTPNCHSAANCRSGTTNLAPSTPPTLSSI
jgi:hypothetical protein